ASPALSRRCSIRSWRRHAQFAMSISARWQSTGEFFRAVATHGYKDEADVIARTPYRSLRPQRELLRGARLMHVSDLQEYDFDPDDTTIPTFLRSSGFRPGLMIPLGTDNA